MSIMYLVTGGSGFIGSNIVAALAEKGHRVAVCDWLGHDDKWKNIAKHGVHDFVVPEQLSGWLGKHGDTLEGIVHMGAISATTERDSDLIIRSNFQLSNELWDFCADRDIPFIYASSAATYGNGEQGFEDDFRPEALARLRPLNPYGWSKLLFDQRVARLVAAGEKAPKKWAGLKFFNVYGPNEYHKGSMRSVVAVNYPKIAAGESMQLFRSYRPDYADGGQKRDFVYVADCVGVILWMLSVPSLQSSVYNLGSGKARSWVDLARAMFAASGLPEKIEFIEMPESLRPRYQYFTEANLTKLRDAGYRQPMTSLEDGVADYVKNYLSREDCWR
jgi:ADP-L-glycero-D-manno-heptose 6-epimerase